MKLSFVLGGVVLLIVLFAARAWWHDSLPVEPEAPPAVTPEDPAKSPETAQPVTVKGQPEPPSAGPVEAVQAGTGDAPKGSLSLPDGSWVQPLNGVTDPAPLSWPAGRPWSPIVGKRWGPGEPPVRWYVHADGSSTTTVMVWREDLGRSDASTITANPAATQPLDPEATGK